MKYFSSSSFITFLSITLAHDGYKVKIKNTACYCIKATVADLYAFLHVKRQQVLFVSESTTVLCAGAQQHPGAKYAPAAWLKSQEYDRVGLNHHYDGLTDILHSQE